MHPSSVAPTALLSPARAPVRAADSSPRNATRGSLGQGQRDAACHQGTSTRAASGLAMQADARGARSDEAAVTRVKLRWSGRSSLRSVVASRGVRIETASVLAHRSFGLVPLVVAGRCCWWRTDPRRFRRPWSDTLHHVAVERLDQVLDGVGVCGPHTDTGQSETRPSPRPPQRNARHAGGRTIGVEADPTSVEPTCR